VRGQRLRGEIAQKQQQIGEAEEWLRQALLLARSVGNPTQLWRTYLAMGHLYRARKQPAQAQEYYQAACDVIYRIKARMQNAELRESLEHSPLIQQIYHFRASKM
jgi:tetratricopeptide (TPR) repeat protein